MKVVKGTEGLEERKEGRKNDFNTERGKKDERNNKSA
jgi:hypothetical protein